MTYADAKRRIRVRRVLGSVVWILCALAWLVLAMRAIDATDYRLATIRSGIVWVYENVPLFPTVWYYIPVIDSQMTREAVIAIGGALLAGFGVAGWFFQSAIVLAARLRRIDEEIENEMIRESIRPGRKRDVVEIRHHVVIPKSSIWEFFHGSFSMGVFPWELFRAAVRAGGRRDLGSAHTVLAWV